MKLSRLRKTITVLVLIIFTSCTFYACNRNEIERYFFFGTIIEVNLQGRKTVSTCKSLGSLFQRLDNLFDAENELSDMYRINNADEEEIIDVSSDTYDLLSLSKTMYEKTNGVFNIATYALSQLWQFTSEQFNEFNLNYLPPSQEKIDATLYDCDLNNVVLLGDNKIKKTNPNTKIGLGAVAKGYAGDCALSCGAVNESQTGILNIGGTIFTVGNKKFNIGIGNPRESSFDYFGKVTVDSGAIVCTSGDYQRFYTSGDKRYHHILGKNGYPTDNGIISVTIISQNHSVSGAMCDILSTAVFALGKEQGGLLISEYEASAVIIYEDKTFDLINCDDGLFTLKDTGYTQNV